MLNTKLAEHVAKLLGKRAEQVVKVDKKARINEIKELKKKADYNGWSNYETWNCALWFDQDDYYELKDREGEFEDEGAVADYLKDIVEEGTPDLGASMYADILNAGLGEIDYYAIAKTYIEDNPGFLNAEEDAPEVADKVEEEPK